MKTAMEYIQQFHGTSGLPSLRCVENMFTQAQQEAYEAGQLIMRHRAAIHIHDKIGGELGNLAMNHVCELPIKPLGGE